MKNTLYLMLAALVGIFILQNCKHEVPDKPEETKSVPVTTSDTCHFDTVYFVNDILPIIQSNCAQSGCHDAISREDDVQLTDYDNMKGPLRARRRGFRRTRR